ncbi:MAG TPA: transglycosylase domain-containing protein [Chthoniobacterales bacterium]
MWEYKPRPPFYARPWFLTIAGIAALVFAAGLIFFWYWTTKYEGKAAQYNLSQLGKMETASLIFDRKGKQIGKILAENREVVPLSQISRNLANAVVAAEDNRFYEHGGVDYIGMVRAALKNYQAGKIRQGASTVTQQLARNSFDLKERTYERKIVEAFLARRIEQNYSKDRIMEYYLNRVYFGGGLYGAEAAARGYFGKPASELSISDSAMLAGLLKSPNGMSPWRNLDAAQSGRDFVLGRMKEIALITEAQYDEAIRTPLRVKKRKLSTGGQSYALDYIRQQVTSELDFDSAARSGYRIYTTLDADLQKVAEDSLRKNLAIAEKHPGFNGTTMTEWKAAKHDTSEEKTDNPTAATAPDYLQGAVMAVESGTGGIVILVGGRDFADSPYDRAMYSMRPPGTAFTPFVFGAGFQNGIFPGTLVDDSALDNRQVMIGGYTGILGEWGAESDTNTYEGLIPARKAVNEGKNAATVRFGIDVGLEKLIELAKKAGLDGNLRPFPATFLGSSEVSLAQLTLAYTIFPSGGARPEKPFIITRVEESDGTVVYQARPTRDQVVSPAVAFEVHSFLTDVLERGTAANASSEFKLKSFPGGGKTGTAYNFTDVWFVGYDSELTVGVWAGFDKRRPIYRGAFSNRIVLPVWVDIMNASTTDFPPKEILRPSNIERVEICSASGLPATRDCFKEDEHGLRKRTTYFEFATRDQTPRGTCYVHGGDGAPDLARQITSSAIPRAAAAINLTTVQPVIVKSSSVIGDTDPYQSARPVMRAVPLNADPGSQPLNAKGLPPELAAQSAASGQEQGVLQVRRAEQVLPLDAQQNQPALNIEPPPPLDLQ